MTTNNAINNIVGAYGVTPGGTQSVALIGSTGELGSVASLPNSLGGGGLKWNNVSGTTQLAVAFNGYILSNASTTTVTLPATGSLGDTIAIVGGNLNTGGWILASSALQILIYKNVQTTAGAGHSWYTPTSSADGSCATIVCTYANAGVSYKWTITSFTGSNLTNN